MPRRGGGQPVRPAAVVRLPRRGGPLRRAETPPRIRLRRRLRRTAADPRVRAEGADSMTRHNLIALLAVLVLVALLFGGFGAPHAWGYWGWSPLGLVLFVLLL